MFSSHEIQAQRQKAYLRKQRLLAKKHRKHMRLRNMKKVHYSGDNNSFKKPPFFILFIIATYNSLVSLWFLIKDFIIGIPTHLSLFAMDSIYILKKLWHKIIYASKKRLVKMKSSYRQNSAYVKKNISLQPINKKIQELPIMTKKTPQPKTSKKPTRLKVRKPKKKKTFWSIIKKLFIFGVILFFAIVGAFFIWFSTLEIPSVDNFENRKISNSTKIYDKTGEILLYDIHEDIRRTIVDFDEIAGSAKNAIVAIEDHTFYEHGGVVWRSTVRAFTQTVLSRLGLSNAGTAGGSTLTQQVVKNTLLNRDKVLSRKVKEWVLAYKIEAKLSKEEILEIYLNEAPYGGTIYGIQEASKRFFGVSASELSISQSAYLAAIPNLPTFYSPYGPNKDKLDIRQRTVLGEMKRYGFITEEQYRSSLSEKVEFISEEEGYAKSLHFVQYVRAQLEETYGVDMVQNGGLQVITTLDYELQQQAEEIIKNHIEEVEKPFDASNAGLVAIESETGHIITMVGSRDYFDTDGFDGNFNVATSPRQPGSSFKPLAYATAFERGYLPESTIFDTETQFNSSCEAADTTSEEGCYSPNNYDFKFNGPMTFRNALAQSRNIPAIKVNHLAGLSRVIQKSKDMGITSLTQSPSFYGLGLVLGGGEVSLLEMTSAYGVFSNDGVYNKPTGIIQVTDVNGEILEKYVSNEERVLDENATRMVNSILSDNEARKPLFGAQSFLYFGDRDVAAKTGTTNDNRDAWLIGYTPKVAVGVWTGNNDNSPMKKGSSISGKPWRKYMDEVIKNYENTSFGEYSLPDNFASLPNMIRGDWYGGTTVYVDTVSGKLATEFTPEETKIAIPRPEPHTILHWINKNDPTVLSDSRNDAQYKNWEYSVDLFSRRNLSSIIGINIDIPTEYDDVHLANGQVAETSEDIDFSIRGLDEGETYDLDESIDIQLRNVDREDEILLVQLFINNAFIASDESSPFRFEFTPEDLPYFEENNLARIIISDEDGGKTSKEISFTLDI